MGFFRRFSRNNYTFVTRLGLAVAFATIPSLIAAAQSPGADAAPNLDIVTFGVIAAVVLIILGLPVAYFLASRTAPPRHSLLFVSTDEKAQPLITAAARRVGYRAIPVYRYEDALEKLRLDNTLSMIVIDDSVPQYEAGLLISMLQGSPIGIRPLILIHDSSELGQTAPSYRAEVVVTRPLTEKALEAAIRQVSERIEEIWD